ncbi:hypothetical protein RB653_007792 [Dictyostelium firmibasis]|uniref:EF-hand domain-containing protein n=1 Tax=Dictyostelium firmibasis TaxID=79012 RepID=A0AAN7U534_9MYCE
MVEFKALFLKECDSNKDGKVTYREIYSGLKKNDKNFSTPYAIQMFRSYDENKDGEISIEEFMKKATHRYLLDVQEKVLKEMPLLKQFDKNKDGLLSYDELAEVFKSDPQFTKYYKEWTDWAFNTIGKEKTYKLKESDAEGIIAVLIIEAENR